MKTLTRTELARRWHCSEKTIRRRELEHGLRPAGFIGNQPVYSIQDVTRTERRVTEHKRRTVGRRAVERGDMPAKGSPARAGRIISVQEARRRASKGGAR